MTATAPLPPLWVSTVHLSHEIVRVPASDETLTRLRGVTRAPVELSTGLREISQYPKDGLVIIDP